MHSPAFGADDLLQRYPLASRIWLAPQAQQQVGAAIGSELHGTDCVAVDPAQCDDLEGPAVLVLCQQDISNSAQREALLRAAESALPGRPVVYGGASDKALLLDAINYWRAFRLVPSETPVAMLIDAISKAQQALHLQYALDRGVIEFREEAKRLQFALNRLRETQAGVLRNERLSAIGRVTGSLATVISEGLDQLELFSRVTAAIRDDQEFETLRQRALDSFHASRALLADIAAFASASTDEGGCSKSRAEERRPIPERLGEMVERAVAIMQYDRDAKNRDLSIEASDEAVALVDRHRLFHVLINLLRNAVQATMEGDAIVVRSYVDRSRAIIEIQDSGHGMPESTRSRLFVPFFSTKGAEGLGLGLYMCQLTVERFGGVIDCSSEMGKGTTFRLSFPQVTSSAAAVLVS